MAGQGASPVTSLKDLDFVCFLLHNRNELLRTVLILPGSFNPQYSRLKIHDFEVEIHVFFINLKMHSYVLHPSQI